MQPWQERVVKEKEDLDEKLGKLLAYIGPDGFMELSHAERLRLTCQASAMIWYSEILGERILDTNKTNN